VKASLPHRSSLAFKRTSLEVLAQTQGRSFTYSGRKKCPLFEHFERKDFINGLGYVVDVFNHTNAINPSVQGREVTIMDDTEKLQAFLVNCRYGRGEWRPVSLQTFKCWRKCFFFIIISGVGLTSPGTAATSGLLYSPK
jgi:hypothetical protein